MADAPGRPGEPESIAEVLASIRALVSAETEARLTGKGGGETVLMLTGDMRVPGGLAEGLGRPAAASVDANTEVPLVEKLLVVGTGPPPTSGPVPGRGCRAGPGRWNWNGAARPWAGMPNYGRVKRVEEKLSK